MLQFLTFAWGNRNNARSIFTFIYFDPGLHLRPDIHMHMSNIAVNSHGTFYLHRQPFKIQCLSDSMVLFNALKNKQNSKFCSLQIKLTSY